MPDDKVSAFIDVWNALECLDEKKRDVVVSYYVKGETYKEIGKRYGVSGNRIMQITQGALRRLRHTLRAYPITLPPPQKRDTERERSLAVIVSVEEEYRDSKRCLRVTFCIRGSRYADVYFPLDASPGQPHKTSIDRSRLYRLLVSSEVSCTTQPDGFSFDTEEMIGRRVLLEYGPGVQTWPHPVPQQMAVSVYSNADAVDRVAEEQRRKWHGMRIADHAER